MWGYKRLQDISDWGENKTMFSSWDKIQSRFQEWKLADEWARMSAEEEETETPAKTI